MRKTNKNAVLVLVLLLLVAVSAMMVASTYAKYTAEITGTGTMTVAKWAFKTDNPTGKTYTVNITPTANASTLVGGKVAPGTSGSFNVDLVNTNSEVGVDFEIALGTVSNKPTNLKFYKDSGFTTELTPGTSKITGQLAAKDSTTLSVPVYWKWEYYTSDANDALDTTDGEAAASLTLDVTVKGVQTPPSATAIQSHVN